MTTRARVDWKVVLRNVGDDPGLLAEISGLFLSQAPGFLCDIQESHAAGDAARVKAAVHRLRGSILVFGETTAARLAQEIELRANAGELVGAESVRGLEDAVAALGVEVRAEAEAERHATSRPSPQSKSVLVIDDSSIARLQAKRALQSGGFVVVEAVDGVEGLERLAESKEIAVILCDMNMPRLNGLQFVQAVRAEESYAHIEILMLTADWQSDLLALAKSLGVKGWIHKPFDHDRLRETVRALMAESA
jgi:two-component system chemotaxis response regulator CheY